MIKEIARVDSDINKRIAMAAEEVNKKYAGIRQFHKLYKTNDKTIVTAYNKCLYGEEAYRLKAVQEYEKTASKALTVSDRDNRLNVAERDKKTIKAHAWGICTARFSLGLNGASIDDDQMIFLYKSMLGVKEIFEDKGPLETRFTKLAVQKGIDMLNISPEQFMRKWVYKLPIINTKNDRELQMSFNIGAISTWTGINRAIEYYVSGQAYDQTP